MSGNVATPARRRRRTGASALLTAVPLGAIAAALLGAALRRQQGGLEAWLRPTGAQGPRSSAAAHAGKEDPGRRRLLEGAAVAGVASWAVAPEEAHAFRADRIQNSKAKYVPKIRAYYQKLEGLRDDIYLQMELQKGNSSSRVFFPSRPAQWYDGLDSKMDGVVAFATDEEGFGCKQYDEKVTGKVVFVKRGRCLFAEKMERAKEAGAKSVVVYDVKVSKQPLERQGLSGATRSKGISTRSAGDALTGGLSLLPREQGVTIMDVEKGVTAPELDAVMISLNNGTQIMQAFEAGDEPRILDVKRFQFLEKIDDFIKKDLKKMLAEMEIYSNSMRLSKDDMTDPIIGILKKDRQAFEKAVKAKDYAEIRRTFQAWIDNLDPVIGRWELSETY